MTQREAHDGSSSAAESARQKQASATARLDTIDERLKSLAMSLEHLRVLMESRSQAAAAAPAVLPGATAAAPAVHAETAANEQSPKRWHGTRWFLARLSLWAGVTGLVLLIAATVGLFTLAYSFLLGKEAESVRRAGEALDTLAAAQNTHAAALDSDRYRLVALGGQVEEATKKIDNAREKYEAAVQQLKGRQSQLDKKIDEADKKVVEIDRELGLVGSNIASKIGNFVQTNYKAPAAEIRDELNQIGKTLQNLRDLTRRAAIPERAALVVFNSGRFDAERIHDAVGKVVRGPYRDGYRNYQMALFLASDGKVQGDRPLVEYSGDDPSKTLRDPWNRDINSTENVPGLDPASLFPPGWSGARRCVLVASTGAIPPTDQRWNDVHVSAVLAGQPLQGNAWADFCKKHRGQVQFVPDEAKLAENVEAALREVLRPTEEVR